MALYEPGVGIFRTHVTWEDLESSLQQVFGSEARFGKNRKITNIGDGKGFMSKMCLIEPDFPEHVSAPKKFVLKICSLMTMVEKGEQMKEMGIDWPLAKPEMMGFMSTTCIKVHNTEVMMYEMMAKYQNKHLPAPKVYYSQKFTEESSKAFIVMEFIDGILDLNIYDNVSAEDLKQILRAIAAFESISLSFSEEERAQFDIDLLKMLGQAFNEKSMRDMLQSYRKFAHAEMGDQIDKIEEIIPGLCNMEAARKLGENVGIPKILCHGDLWIANTLWKSKQNGGMKMEAVIDFQGVHFGDPAMDLVRVLAACLSGKERQEQWEFLLETFYGYLLEEIGDHGVPYTLDQIKESYRRFFPLGGVLIALTMGRQFEANSNDKDEGLRAKIKESIIEKSKSLLEDVLENHERNTKIQANFE